MTGDFAWQDPPPAVPRGPKGIVWRGIADALREKPGQRALVASTKNSTYASQISQGMISAFRPRGSFEAVQRSVYDADGVKFLNTYARFVGAS